MNILLIAFDSLRKDCSGAYGAPPWGGPHAPFRRLRRASASHDANVSRIPAHAPDPPRTVHGPARLSLSQRRFPAQRRFRWRAGLGTIPEDQSTFAEMLSEHGTRYRVDLGRVPHVQAVQELYPRISSNGCSGAARKPTLPARGRG